MTADHTPERLSEEEFIRQVVHILRGQGVDVRRSDVGRVYDWLAPRLAAHLADVEARLAAVAGEAWKVAHDEACDLGPYCSAHQPIQGRPGFQKWLELVAVLTPEEALVEAARTVNRTALHPDAKDPA